MHSRLKSYTLVAIQFTFIFYITWTAPILAYTPLWLAVEMVGLFLGLWAVWSMRLFNFNITPSVKVEGYMVERGPYRFVRHPMYSSLLVMGVPLVADYFSWLRLLALLGLAVDLVVKLRYEEGLLAAHYPQYAAYMNHTKRLIPFVW
jgi:protein-S-isoprenylcysteine O-methyltransferase Ste14